MNIILTLILSIVSLMGLYPRAAVVVNTDRAADIVTVEDSTGNLWDFCGVEDWCEGDGCAMLMYDNGTPEIMDDAIISVRYNNIVLGN